MSETEHEKHSRVTIVTTGTRMVIEQIKNQLDRLVPIHRVVDMTEIGSSIQRELAMVKVRGRGDDRIEALRLADAFRARVIDASLGELYLRDHRRHRQDRQIREPDDPARPRREVSRTGVAAIQRGAEGMGARAAAA
ncbi:MAG: acetolactate synthase small subunit [Xanthobacteraceae bacterium]